MAIKRAILNLGQSNAEPKASRATYLAAVPDMNYLALTPDPAISAWYGYGIETIKVATFYLDPTGTATPAGSPPAPFATLGWNYYCKFLPLNWNSGTGPADYGFQYPNLFTIPHASYTASVNSVADLARRMQGHFKDEVYVVTCAIDSSQLQHTETALAGLSARCWFDPRVHNNWAPGDDGAIFARVREVLTGAKLAATEEGNTLIIELVTMKQGETDVQNTPAANLFPTNAPAFVAAVRALIQELGLCDVPGYQIPFTWQKLPPIWGSAIPLVSYPGYPENYALINATLQQMQEDDPYFATYETSDFSLPDIHYDATGIQQIAEADFAAYLAIKSRATASLSLADVPTLESMTTAVRRLTERNTSDAGQVDVVITEAINESLFYLLNYVGDSAWWTRITTRIVLSASPQVPVQLPRCVTRLLEMRPASDPWATIDTSMVRHNDNGRVEIITLDRWDSVEVDLHHQYEPAPVSVATERLFIPRNYAEAVKVGAARRVAANAGNATLEAKLVREEERLLMQVSQHANKVDRQRRQRLTGRRGTRYRSQLGPGTFNYPWRDA